MGLTPALFYQHKVRLLRCEGDFDCIELVKEIVDASSLSPNGIDKGITWIGDSGVAIGSSYQDGFDLCIRLKDDSGLNEKMFLLNSVPPKLFALQIPGIVESSPSPPCKILIIGDEDWATGVAMCILLAQPSRLQDGWKDGVEIEKAVVSRLVFVIQGYVHGAQPSRSRVKAVGKWYGEHLSKLLQR
jgi:hypothetical protein